MNGIILKGKVACITGASRGIGAGIARALAKEGCHLGICSRKEADIEQMKKELEVTGCSVVACVVDVANMDQVKMDIGMNYADESIQRSSTEEVWHH